MDATDILTKLIQKQNLTTQETQLFLSEVMKGNISHIKTAAILTAFRMKGETVNEITGLIKSMRENMIRVKADMAIDICGTGGDGSGSFNISTATAFVVAGAGVKVAKHGNRAASSKCGSADVLEELGVNLKLSAVQAEAVFNKVGMVFLFAPLFHPLMKNVVEVRKELKIRTIFNFLGPFANPASVCRQLIGVPNIEIAEKLAKVGKKLGYKHLLIVTGKESLDEISIFSKTLVFEIKGNSIKKFVVDPQKYGYKKDSKKEIQGESAKQNAFFIKQVLQGIKSAKRDIVVLNSAFALYVSGKVSNIKQGINLAQASIDNGNAKLILENLVRETQKYA